VSALPTNKKNHAVRRGNFLTPPKKTFGLRSAQPKKKRRNAPLIPMLVLLWWDFTPKSEPISEKICKAEPQRQAGATRPLRPSNTPQIIFLQLLL
jgi:hypothetical protein